MRKLDRTVIWTYECGFFGVGVTSLSLMKWDRTVIWAYELGFFSVGVVVGVVGFNRCWAGLEKNGLMTCQGRE